MFLGIILIGAIIYFLMNPSNNFMSQSKEDDALRILKERYVRGEIDEETYQKMKRTLES